MFLSNIICNNITKVLLVFEVWYIPKLYISWNFQTLGTYYITGLKYIILTVIFTSTYCVASYLRFEEMKNNSPLRRYYYVLCQPPIYFTQLWHCEMNNAAYRLALSFGPLDFNSWCARGVVCATRSDNSIKLYFTDDAWSIHCECICVVLLLAWTPPPHQTPINKT